ncbi:hypothetical protein [Nocardia miyunensis]|uniref:hypothetical protein n=1 Tax=Nocardia miyunensis TaxID=282684 RepID=UPI00083414C8|nr:hypothetical protein [Nocardia miyunensis]
MSPLSPWDVTANIITVIAGSAVTLLALGCLWPSSRPTRRPSGPTTRPSRCPLRPIQWPAEWTCAAPLSPFTIPQAHRIMQLHRDHDCPRKHAAFATLVAAGRITPDSARHRP